MARTDDDSWDLATSVGATATMVAAARAMASRADNPMISDPFAEPLVRAVGIDLFTRLATGELSAEELDTDELMGMRRMTDNMAVRTKFFDDFFLTATGGGGFATETAAGVTQAVILAAGLDARGYRLPWPTGTVVFEIDQPDVIAFKSQVIGELGAEPTADLRHVAVDLRDDWPAALRAAGFDPATPTAWSAEGLLGYLPPDAQDRLLDTVTELSAVGSRIATESAPNVDPAAEDEMRERMKAIADRWRAHGFDLDFAELVYFGERNVPAEYLTERGWQMTGSTLRDLFVRHGLPPFDDDDQTGFADMQYVSGTLVDKIAR
ncbi:class I SAM-dependent methyltransferase [Mycobacterium sp. MYCO198283]|uniref:SAM-dependent methyltransferase n=1 Tax=Mycobacterium sp. MYCO198283 TaxID=2883505 RepID=UPI001E612A17|nr:class I SAM-dependent methyltransferase [Mycobacterium sp. MYCO198283]MCG5431841.1 class I SAM-dependent methyltransferase [Mycobacterium sp. MYCO198283]